MTRSSQDPLELEELADLSKQMLALAVEVSSAIDPRNVVVGRDDSGTVRAVVDCTGGVREIQLEGRWIEEIRPSELGRAVRSANQDGQSKRIAAWARTGADLAAVPARLPQPASAEPDPRELAMDGPHGDPAAVLRRVAKAFAKETEGRAPSNRVRILAIGPTVTEVLIDERWLEQAHHEEIAEQVTRAFHDLYGKLPDEVVNSLAIDAISPEIDEVRREIALFELRMRREAP